MNNGLSTEWFHAALRRTKRYFEPPEVTYWWTRQVLIRLLGAIYAIAFLVLFHQGLPLIGSSGLLPADDRRSASVTSHNSACHKRIPQHQPPQSVADGGRAGIEGRL